MLASDARSNVRFGSKADIGASVTDVRFTPESGHSLECTPWGGQLGDRELAAALQRRQAQLLQVGIVSLFLCIIVFDLTQGYFV